MEAGSRRPSRFRRRRSRRRKPRRSTWSTGPARRRRCSSSATSPSRRTDPDYIPLVVANRILGGGSSGRLFQNIREQKGYTYGAYSSLSAPRWPGIWGASASVRTPVTEPAAAEFFKEFARLQDEPVPDEELERAKRSIIGSFALTLENPQGVLARTMDLVENGLPLDYWDTYPAKIQAVTAEDVQRVARKYLGKNRSSSSPSASAARSRRA